MLDQNTDRMWYVIGALVVGAGIILLANKTIPEIFASVGGMMNDLIDVIPDGSSKRVAISDLPQDYNLISQDNIENGTFNWINGGLAPGEDRQFERMIEPVSVQPNSDYYVTYELVSNLEGNGWGTELAWIFYDEDMNPIRGDNLYSYDNESFKTTIVHTPDDAQYMRLRFGRTGEEITTDTERSYYMAEYDRIRNVLN